MDFAKSVIPYPFPVTPASISIKIRDVLHAHMGVQNAKVPTNVWAAVLQGTSLMEVHVNLNVVMEKLLEEFNNVMIETKLQEMVALLPAQLKLITDVMVNHLFVRVQLHHHQHQIVEMEKEIHLKHVMMETQKTETGVQVVVQLKEDILVIRAVHQSVQRQQEIFSW